MPESGGDDRDVELERLRQRIAELEAEGTALAEAERAQRLLERRLLETQKLESLAVLAGGVAHDFNNLLTVILGNADLARAESPPESPLRPFLEAIEHAGRRAADLCRQMLAFAGKGRYVIAPLDLAVVLRDSETVLRSALPSRAALALAVPPSLPPVLGDASQFCQAVVNLVSNASEALSDGEGVVNVSAGRAFAGRDELAEAVVGADLPVGEYVYVDVQDHGGGMTEEVRRRAFEPFFSTKFTGRGLGLSAVLGIVRGHGGALLLTTAPGRGCAVRLLFPRHGVATCGAAPVGDAWRGSGLVLLAEDEAGVRAVTTRLLEGLGFRVTAAADGRAVVALFAEVAAEARLALLDQSMPGLDGEAVVRELRRLRPDLPVVLMSGRSDGEVAQRFPADGPIVFMQKPFRLADLTSKVRAALGE
jgi:signal transduction histidine kinase/CheY-like chemotaxis protein